VRFSFGMKAVVYNLTLIRAVYFPEQRWEV
jgi:hypothetical protein